MLPAVSCGFLVVFLRLSHGILAGFLQVSRGFPSHEPMISGAHLKGHIRYLKLTKTAVAELGLDSKKERLGLAWLGLVWLGLAFSILRSSF